MAPFLSVLSTVTQITIFFKNNITRSIEETHLILVGLLLVADRQVRSVDIHIDVAVTGDAPAALLSCRHSLELHLGITALLPLLPRRGQAVDPPVHIHRP